MTQEDFMSNILGNAQKLCNPEMNKAMDKIAKNARLDENGDMDPSSFDGDASSWDKMFLSEAAYDEAKPTAQPKAPVITQRGMNKSRVPDFIKQSMISEAIDTTALSDNPLDRMDLSKFQVKQATPRQQVNEQVSVPQQTSGIDYTIIKAIINECIDNKLKEYGLTKQSLNENTLKTIHLKGGNIKLVDNSGNVYSAQLERKGNINDKK